MLTHVGAGGWLERLALVGQPSREKAGRSPAQARNGKTGTDALDYTLARLGESARERALYSASMTGSASGRLHSNFERKENGQCDG